MERFFCFVTMTQETFIGIKEKGNEGGPIEQVTARNNSGVFSGTREPEALTFQGVNGR